MTRIIRSVCPKSPVHFYMRICIKWTRLFGRSVSSFDHFVSESYHAERLVITTDGVRICGQFWDTQYYAKTVKDKIYMLDSKKPKSYRFVI